MPDEHAYDYAIIRVVPRVERGELMNVGVILSCPGADFLAARIALDRERLLALDPGLDIDAIQAHLATIPAVCRGGAGAGPIGALPQRNRFHGAQLITSERARQVPIGALPQRNRFHWLVSPRSTVIQISPVHTGRTSDPSAALERLLDQMVR